MQSWAFGAKALNESGIYQTSWLWRSPELHTWKNHVSFAPAVIQHIQLKSPLPAKQVSVCDTKQKYSSSLQVCVKW